MNEHEWTPREARFLKSLSTPWKIQKFLNSLPYNIEPDGITCRSPRQGHARLAPHIASKRSIRCGCPANSRLAASDPRSGCRARFRSCDRTIPNGRLLGAIAQSNYAGIRFREPVYRTIRELAISYFEDYINLRGEKTLRGYSRPVHLSVSIRLADDG
jgi:hypothetical protein